MLGLVKLIIKKLKKSVTTLFIPHELKNHDGSLRFQNLIIQHFLRKRK